MNMSSPSWVRLGKLTARPGAACSTIAPKIEPGCSDSVECEDAPRLSARAIVARSLQRHKPKYRHADQLGSDRASTPTMFPRSFAPSAPVHAR